MMLFGLRTYLKVAAGLGLEPRYSGPKPDVLPLDDPAMTINIVRDSIYSIFISFRKYPFLALSQELYES